METIIDLEMEDYHYNENLLKEVAEKFGSKVAEEIEYEMFADTGSIGKAALQESDKFTDVGKPNGKFYESLVPDNVLKGAWITEPIYKDEEGSPVFATYLQLDETTYFMFYCRH
jgi:hypothetical protein